MKTFTVYRVAGDGLIAAVSVRAKAVEDASRRIAGPIEGWMRESGLPHPQVFELVMESSIVGVRMAVKGELAELTIEERERIVHESGFFELLERLDGQLPS